MICEERMESKWTGNRSWHVRIHEVAFQSIENDLWDSNMEWNGRKRVVV